MKLTLRTATLLGLALSLVACGPSAPAPGTNPGQAGGPPPQGQGSGQGQAPAGQGGGPGGQGGNRRSAVVAVQVETSRVGALAVDNTAAGAVSPDTQSSVAAGASGTVKTLIRKAGDWVEAGTAVLALDDAQLKLSVRLAQATLDTAKLNAGVGASGDSSTNSGSKLNLQLQSAQSALSSAEKNWASAQALKKIDGISGSDYDNAQVQLQTAQANLESAKMGLQSSGLAVETATIQLQQAQLNLANAIIRAPYAGQVSVINVHPGEYVGPSTAVFGLVSRLKVISFSVAPTDAPGLTIGKAVKFTYAGKTLPTKITQTPSAPVNGLVTLTASLPQGMDASFGTVGTISYSVVLATGTIIPLPALQSAENKTFVFTVNNNKAARVEVGILAESGTYAAVSGLAGNLQVILNPPPGLLVGAQVQPVGAQAPPAAGGPGKSQGQDQGQGQGKGNWSGKRPTGDAGTAPVEGTGPAAGAGNGQRRQNGQGGPNAGASPPTPSGGQ